MVDLVLRSPTVGDVIEFLSRLKKDAPFALDDPDTGWRVDYIHVGSTNGYVTFGGEYHEMTSNWCKERLREE